MGWDWMTQSGWHKYNVQKFCISEVGIAVKLQYYSFSIASELSVMKEKSRRLTNCISSKVEKLTTNHKMVMNPRSATLCWRSSKILMLGYQGKMDYSFILSAHNKREMEGYQTFCLPSMPTAQIGTNNSTWGKLPCQVRNQGQFYSPVLPCS